MTLEFRQDRHDAIIAKIEADPGCWLQTNWHCGTKHCYAGLAQIDSGKQPNASSVRVDARIWLGLNICDADWLFDVSRTLSDLKNFTPTTDRYGRDGYNRKGYNRKGYDRKGYDRDGYDRDGLDLNNQRKLGL